MTQEEILKRCLFIPCDSKESLHRWIKIYLGFDLPDVVVHPESNSCPMEFVWEIYSKALADNDPDFTRILGMSSRDSYKTLSSAILEVLFMVHCGRSTCHLAAIETQAGFALGYVKNFLSRPYLKDYVIGDNKREVELIRFEDPQTGFAYTIDEYKNLSEIIQNKLIKKHNYVRIIILTRTASNGNHSSSVVLDEAELAKTDGYEEAKLIPGPWGVKNAITTLVSTRKTAFGLVQKEIDEAAKTGLHLRHWNIIDVTEACPTERHLPEQPKVNLYVNDTDLSVLDETQFNLADERTQNQYHQQEMFAGCAKCPLAAMCKGLLATKQRKDKSDLPIVNLYKPIPHTISLFKKVSPEMAQAQLMTRKPESTGLIYSKIDRNIHMLTASQMIEKATGEPAGKNFTKDELIDFFIKNDAKFYSGMDFGWAHDFAVVTGVVWGNYIFIIDSVAKPGLELDEKIAACEHLKIMNPIIFPDPEDPASAATFRTKGHFKVRKWHKEKGSVKAGIEIVRSKLKPTIGLPTMFFLRDDEGCNNLFVQMSRYHFKQDVSGNITDEPDKENDDSCFTESLEVLSNRGWLKIKDLKESDEVLAVTKEGAAFFEKPLAIINKHYEGDGYKIKHHHLEFTATSDHSHAVMRQMDWKVKKQFKLEKRTVDDMCGEMYWANNLKDWPFGKGLFKQGPDEAWMAGFWVAEGCFDTGRPTFIIFDQTKLNHKEKFREIIKRLDWTWSETISDFSETLNTNQTRFVVSRQKERVIEWRNLFGELSYQKKLTVDSIFKMTQEERQAFWEGYMCGDGSRTQSAWHFDSTSRELLDGLQILTLTLGYGCRVIDYYDCFKPRMQTFPSGNAYMSRQSYRANVLRKGAVAHIDKKIFNKITLNEQVYCVRTTTGMFFARDNGKPFVAGNCDAARYLVMNVFNNKGKVMAAIDDGVITSAPKQLAMPITPAQALNKEFQAIIDSHLDSSRTNIETEDSTVKKKSSKFVFDIG